MITLKELERTVQETVEGLPQEERRQFFDWIAELKADLWDKQIEEDFMAGRMDKFLEEAMSEPDAAEFRDGRWREL